jgi:release factor glutamine methyltransferase
MSDVVDRLRAAGCVFAEDEAALLVEAAASPDDLVAMVDQRVAGLPLEHVVGWADFCGLRIAVAAGVFVPRRRTECLALEAARLAAVVATRPAVVLDLCCGSGAVGAVVVGAVPGVELYAADVESAAVRCARRNLGDRGHVCQGDLYEPLPAQLRGRVDVLVANAPYVPTEEISLMPPEARLHEPAVALDGGTDGLRVLRRVTEAASQWLAPGGHLLFETSERQAPEMLDFAARAGLTPRLVQDEGRGATVVVAAHSPR